MAKHIIERGLSQIEKQAADVWQQLENAFAEMESAIASGSRAAQNKALATLKGLSELSHNLIGATHSHATALMVGHTPSPVEQATEDGEAKTKARMTRTSVPTGE